jgi:DNA polymerase III subunit epsilon
LAPYALKPWPYRGTIAVREADMTRERTDVHLFRDWCWLGTAHDEGEFGDMLEYPRRTPFDLDVYRLLVRCLPRSAVTELEIGKPRPKKPNYCTEQAAK